jgi:hypothetical protein
MGAAIAPGSAGAIRRKPAETGLMALKKLRNLRICYVAM